MMHRPAHTYLAPLVLALTLTACGAHEEGAKTAAAPRVVQAPSAVVQAQDAPAYAVTPGTVVAEESIKVASRLMGYIRDIAVVEGQSVKAGQRLFTIDPLDIEGAVEQARLGLNQAENALKDAKADYDRYANLHKEEVVTRQQYEKMKLNYEIAVSRAAQAKAGLTTAQGQMRYATVVAPFAGVVTQKLANEGDIAAPGHPVLVLENPARLQVQTAVPESVFKTLTAGQTVDIEVDGQTDRLKSRIARLSPAADPMTHTYLVKLDLQAKVKSGTFARVLFPAGQTRSLRVPQTALQNRAGIIGVFVLNAQGIAQYRMVRTGTISNNSVEILSGLNAGDRVVTDQAATINNGDQVKG
jgi:RND family efflux transporter MFP subunit